MSKASQGLRALANSLQTITSELSPQAQAALGEAASELHAAADAQAAMEASKLAGPVAGSLLGVFAVSMVDSFFSLFAAKQAQIIPAASGPEATIQTGAPAAA